MRLMTLEVGSRLAHYEILEPLGAVARAKSTAQSAPSSDAPEIDYGDFVIQWVQKKQTREREDRARRRRARHGSTARGARRSELAHTCARRRRSASPLSKMTKRPLRWRWADLPAGDLL